MIAVSIFALSQAGAGIPKYLMSFEVFSYIFLTIYTIRALKSLSLEVNYNDRERYMVDIHNEVVQKYALTQVSLALTIVVTILLLVFSFHIFCHTCLINNPIAMYIDD